NTGKPAPGQCRKNSTGCRQKHGWQRTEHQNQRAVLRCIEPAGRRDAAFRGLLTNHLKAGTAPQKLEIGIDNNV
ncbi:MAG: hypothetical protein WBO19_04270, partial [Terriglobia bacterium]